MKPATRVASIATVIATISAVVPAVASAADPAPCTDTHWVGAFEAPATDSGRTGQFTDAIDSSANPRITADNSSVRSVLTPTLGGSQVRVRLSNQYGPAPLELDDVQIARRASGASIEPGTSTRLHFGGAASVTIPAGQEALSDPVDFSLEALKPIAVSVHAPGDVGGPTVHFAARQTSYATPAGSGDQTGEQSGASYPLKTTTRPFVTGLDVQAPCATGSVVAFGSSLTDGAQNQASGVQEEPSTIDADARYPDFLARRLIALGRPTGVLNAGISGNRNLSDGVLGIFGPAGDTRLEHDVLQQAGVRGVVFWTGYNDVSQSPPASPDDVIAGYQRTIGRFHDAGLRVVQATLTPSEGYPISLAQQPEIEARRQQVNAWIRDHSTADAVVDLDAVIRDPAHPARILPRFDGGDHLHLTPAGHEAVADAIPLDALLPPAAVTTSPSGPATTTTTSSPVAQPTALAPSAAPNLAPAVPRICSSRRRFTVTLLAGLRGVSATLGGRRVQVRRARGRTSVAVDLRGRPRQRVALRVRAVTSAGHAVRITRTYRTCTRAR